MPLLCWLCKCAWIKKIILSSFQKICSEYVGCCFCFVFSSISKIMTAHNHTHTVYLCHLLSKWKCKFIKIQQQMLDASPILVYAISYGYMRHSRTFIWQKRKNVKYEFKFTNCYLHVLPMTLMRCAICRPLCFTQFWKFFLLFFNTSVEWAKSTQWVYLAEWVMNWCFWCELKWECC